MTPPHLPFSAFGVEGAGPVVPFFLDLQQEVVGAILMGTWMPYQGM